MIAALYRTGRNKAIMASHQISSVAGTVEPLIEQARGLGSVDRTAPAVARRILTSVTVSASGKCGKARGKSIAPPAVVANIAPQCHVEGLRSGGGPHETAGLHRAAAMLAARRTGSAIQIGLEIWPKSRAFRCGLDQIDRIVAITRVRRGGCTGERENQAGNSGGKQPGRFLRHCKLAASWFDIHRANLNCLRLAVDHNHDSHRELQWLDILTS